MMMFRTIKTALIQVLGDHAAGRFRVLGYRRQTQGADEMLNFDRLVQVSYTDGDFQKASGRVSGLKIHDLSFEINLTASCKATGDVSALESDTSTAAQKAAALYAIKEAAENADISIDEMIDAVYQILMDARHIDLDLGKGEMASRWIASIRKDTGLPRGDLVVKTAQLKYSCRAAEDVSGDIGVVPDPVIIDTDITGDITSAGVLVENAV